MVSLKLGDGIDDFVFRVGGIMRNGNRWGIFGHSILNLIRQRYQFTPLEIMPRCYAAGLDFGIIPAGFNAPLEFLTGFAIGTEKRWFVRSETGQMIMSAWTNQRVCFNGPAGGIPL
jgi:hypothetical protein